MPADVEQDLAVWHPSLRVMADTDDLVCETCDRAVSREAATRTKPYADLDPKRWQSLCCPTCGRRIKTVLVRPDE